MQSCDDKIKYIKENFEFYGPAIKIKNKDQNFKVHGKKTTL